MQLGIQKTKGIRDRSSLSFFTLLLLYGTVVFIVQLNQRSTYWMVRNIVSYCMECMVVLSQKFCTLLSFNEQGKD